MSEHRPDTATILGGLKDFQRRTVDYVIRRFYLDQPGTNQFLVADEVGLGKTMVAKGVIARSVDLLWDTVDRIDIIYVCSNQAIARQNVKRLSAVQGGAVALPTRLTLLPIHLGRSGGLRDNKVNFISFTPGTALDMKSSGGIVDERAILYRMLEPLVERRGGLFNLLQGGAGRERWGREILKTPPLAELDQDIVARFHNLMRNDAALLEELVEVRGMFGHFRERWPKQHCSRRNALLGRLRGVLARACIGALQPDLIILDEFQRFLNILRGDSEAAELTRQLLNHEDVHGNRARTLFLSATPYKMLTLRHEQGDEDHYRDFCNTVEILYGPVDGPAAVAKLQAELKVFRRILLSGGPDPQEARSAKDRVEMRLRMVMARTERVRNTKARDAMLCEVPMTLTVEPADLRQAVTVERISRMLGTGGAIEYWKSAPYLLNFMRDYALKRAVEKQAADPDLLAVLSDFPDTQLNRKSIDRYEPVPPANSRLRALLSDMVDGGQWRMLWIPPSLPYYVGAGAYAGNAGVTKALVFSSWNVVPNSIAALVSYEVERRMVGREAARTGYFDQHHQMLRFLRQDGRLVGMPALSLLYPSSVLAREMDPLALINQSTELLPLATVRDRLRLAASRLLTGILPTGVGGPEDQRWYWAAPALLDHAGGISADWLRAADGLCSLGDENEVGFRDHVDELAAVMAGNVTLGRPPEDLVDVLVDHALGNPAICALRALRRIAPDAALADPALRLGAASIAWGFRSLFNQRETISLLRQGSNESYWRQILQYSADGNLQSVLDEHVHFLLDSLGVTACSAAERVEDISTEIAEAVAINPTLVQVDALEVAGGGLSIEPFRMRGRFAMRLSDHQDEEQEGDRLETVRTAFNSPFRPFVLATTSVGQEGLDFHPWCHRLYHWNLPSNPVDLEQREGRVHRYKGHAVRRNVAAAFGMKLRRQARLPHDPWAWLFAAAKAANPGTLDLIPYWLFEGETKIERIVPALPYSRELEQFQALKRALSIYRLAFGQPRQDDLLAFLSEDHRADDFEQISLEPGS